MSAPEITAAWAWDPAQNDEPCTVEEVALRVIATAQHPPWHWTSSPGGGYEVYDALGEIVARCTSMDAAEAIACAPNDIATLLDAIDGRGPIPGLPPSLDCVQRIADAPSPRKCTN